MSPTFYVWGQSKCEYTGLNITRSVAHEGCPMPDSYLNGRPVYFGDISYDSYDSCDSYFESASYCDTDQDLDDEELDALTAQCADYIDAQWFEWSVGRAERD
jgi:hypothetical protein